MSDKNKQVIIAYFPGADKADDAADMIKDWDSANDDVKLGGVGILFWEDGKIKTRKVGGRAGKTGAKWGTALGAVAGILSGGVYADRRRRGRCGRRRSAGRVFPQEPRSQR